jgi:pimeloyl-ACP methyl ester carboxylesterase
MRPTIVLVHGAFAESASWDGVVDRLLTSGHDVVRSIEGPVVLVARGS